MHSPRVTLGFTFNRRRPNLLIRNSTAKPCVDYKVAEVLARGIVEDVKRGDVHLVRVWGYCKLSDADGLRSEPTVRNNIRPFQPHFRVSPCGTTSLGAVSPLAVRLQHQTSSQRHADQRLHVAKPAVESLQTATRLAYCCSFFVDVSCCHGVSVPCAQNWKQFPCFSCRNLSHVKHMNLTYRFVPAMRAPRLKQGLVRISEVCLSLLKAIHFECIITQMESCQPPMLEQSADLPNPRPSPPWPQHALIIRL